ncbi:MAG: hypothetical protein CM15mP50_3610 [Rhodobacterales bacterium]|nr:MAG: hypothetical protein CM15mP50_3610 [Rhodobacterales bacterium]
MKNNVIAIAAYSNASMERLEKIFYDYGLNDIGKFQSCNYNTRQKSF